MQPAGELTPARTTASLRMRRRFGFAIVVLVSQMLLIGVSLAWIIHMSLIAAYGSVRFVENNPVVLWVEIAAAVLITLFAGCVLILQLHRLGERRRS